MKSPDNKIMINGFEYGWSNVKVLISNTILTSITAISYAENATLENLYGLGNQPVARGVGNYEYEASITIRKSEILALHNAAKAAGDPAGSLPSILPFTVIVSYERPDGTGIATDILNHCQFTNVSNGLAQGDTSINIELPLIISSISWNKV